MARMNAVPRRLTFARGFTLAEMAVVLVIVALLIAGMMLPLSAQQEIRARQETEKTLSDIREALLGFAVANGRLPRPAISATNGAETRQPVQLTRVRIRPTPTAAASSPGPRSACASSMAGTS